MADTRLNGELQVSVPTELARLADRIGEAVTLAPAPMVGSIEAALAEATNAAVWLPLERRRASHENYARPNCAIRES